ncbi:MAG: SapC family protein [Aquabacterium sp.]
MKTLLMYERLVPIDREQHRQLRIHQGPGRMGFARETNSMLLAATELPLAALDYPCVFVQSGDQHTLIAVVGLRDKENLMISEGGDWAEHSYVPAFVRRYPFVLAEQPGSNEMTLCVDEAFDGLDNSQGEALFDAQGQNTPYLTQLQNFLLSFHQDMLATAQFAQRLSQLGLLVDRSIECQINGERLTLNGFKVVDETKLRALSPDVVQELFASGALGWIHAHLLSLNNVNKLGARLGQRISVQKAAAEALQVGTTH